ncbi:DUF4153 domain-containing protein [Cognatishimia sp. 1_MG-2023]|uniref:DUF4153 domain-containing protein n=1 Tax=Cognatishimia sp. 1_MG-2023 TaxID=3062642 RepID=UPI0026E37FEF|nr:DUF4153 domain-containing protein [Cognatishimia sp. 1_MG-2023]MDO6726361.1 DUF4153 domain-containing protein [Cognatishimia sp. 1_MG-2023]
MHEQTEPPMSPRVWMSLIGGIAGLAAWILFEVLPDTLDNQRLFLWIASATGGFFTVLLALLGPLKARPAVAVAGVLSLTAAALLFWNNGRYLQFDDQFEHGLAPLAWSLLLLIGAPFGAALVERKVRDYAYLFDTAWGIVVRYAAAWVFVGLFWALLFLSDALLSIVGITLIEQLIDEEPVPYVLTGLVLGLALSVAQELRSYVSPYLLLRLLRLLLPMVLLVVTVFIAALPTRGLSQLFGDFSAAAILMGVAIAGVTLITSALDRDEEDAIASRYMRLATKALALLLPILGGLAIWAIWLRVSEYGWTPERLAAAIASGFVMSYAVLYALALLRGTEWTAHIRQANIFMAISALVVAGLWLSPVFNAEKISAETQLTRYLDGKIKADTFPVWELQNTWGKPGQAVIEKLNALPKEDHIKILASLERAKSQSRWQFTENQTAETTRNLSSRITPHVKIWPDGTTLAPMAFAGTYSFYLEKWAEICPQQTTTPCTLVHGPFGAQGEDKALFIVPGQDTHAGIFLMHLTDGKYGAANSISIPGQGRHLSAEQIEQIATGGFRIGPSSRQALWVGDLEISPEN